MKKSLGCFDIVYVKLNIKGGMLHWFKIKFIRSQKLEARKLIAPFSPGFKGIVIVHNSG